MGTGMTDCGVSRWTQWKVQAMGPGRIERRVHYKITGLFVFFF